MRLRLERSMVGNDNQGNKTNMRLAFALYPTEVNVELLYQKHKNTHSVSRKNGQWAKLMCFHLLHK